MSIPKDPMILISYINTQLRDFYSSLTDCCQSLNIEEEELREKLSSVGYHYDSETNQFI